MEATIGHLYILSYSAKRNIYKIGYTNKTPKERADELSRQTGVIGIFKVEWSVQVSETSLVERLLHYKLSDFRTHKEFFEIPLNQAIQIANETVTFLKPIHNMKKLENEARRLLKTLTKNKYEKQLLLHIKKSEKNKLNCL